MHEGFDADCALLAEIDENLARAELSPAEHSLHVGARKEIYERVHPETKDGATGRGRPKVRQNGEANDRFTKDAASKTGKSERSMQRSATRAKRIPAKVLQTFAGTAIDKGEELDALSKLPPEKQRQIWRGETTPGSYTRSSSPRSARRGHALGARSAAIRKCWQIRVTGKSKAEPAPVFLIYSKIR